MPIYHYRCESCGHEEDAYARVMDRHWGPLCCNQGMQLKIVPAHVMPDIEEFTIPGTDQVIRGRKQKREYMREHRLIEVGNEGRPEPGQSRD